MDPREPPEIPELTPQLVVQAYCAGAFPMADGRDGPLRWYSPDPRAVLPIDEQGLRVSQSLRRRVNSGRYAVTMDRAFDRVIHACAEPRERDPDTWISQPIIDVYGELHRGGLAHSVEAWLPGDSSPAPECSDSAEVDPKQDRLVGGLYGVALGGAFFGESMFHRSADASKVCLVALVEHLRQRGFSLLDVQFSNPHLEQFAVVEISRQAYLRRLEAALESGARW